MPKTHSGTTNTGTHFLAICSVFFSNSPHTKKLELKLKRGKKFKNKKPKTQAKERPDSK